MSKLENACKYILLMYYASIFILGMYFTVQAFFADDLEVISPYQGRAEFYLDYMKD